MKGVAVILSIIAYCTMTHGLPVAPKAKVNSHRLSDEEYDRLVKHEQIERKLEEPSPLADLGLEYNRYLEQVINVLETDNEFKNKLQSADAADIRSAKIAEELEYVDHNVRSKLDELKRTELQRLRTLTRQAYNSDHTSAGHIDGKNSATFEVEDLKKLIKQVALDLQEADNKRKEMFKEYEMQKHFEKDQRLSNMTEEQRKRFLAEQEEIHRKKEEIRKNAHLHHPGSKKQLEEVWEQQDHLDKNDFDPRTFFVMHDIDGNGFLDEEEVKALFLRELDKLYGQGVPKADLMEKAEEMERMREHVFSEIDVNKDRMISWEEFYAMTIKPEFQQDPGWKPLDEHQIYTDKELEEFEKRRDEEIERLIAEGKLESYNRNYHIPDSQKHFSTYSSHQQLDPESYAYYRNPVVGQPIPVGGALYSQHDKMPYDNQHGPLNPPLDHLPNNSPQEHASQLLGHHQDSAAFLGQHQPVETAERHQPPQQLQQPQQPQVHAQQQQQQQPPQHQQQQPSQHQQQQQRQHQ